MGRQHKHLSSYKTFKLTDAVQAMVSPATVMKVVQRSCTVSAGATLADTFRRQYFRHFSIVHMRQWKPRELGAFKLEDLSSGEHWLQL